MARVDLQLPEQFYYTLTITVRMTDLNPGGHVGNDQMISLLSEARYRFFCHYGFDEFGVTDQGIIITDLITTYKSESFAQENLKFEVGLMDFNKYGADIIFRVTKHPSGQVVALAKQGFVFFDHHARKVTFMPDHFRRCFPGIGQPDPGN
ncbi:thioesterase family protein [Hydrocarboniclastica marina]|uniref:Thioesterase n=1 Tax=Hydrocarboniclastica marina TaxID=2259620 RepID=A0A4P7XI67_9ALTE|nr:thioesterase family protein [Hydrocarboniclastica marina]QCF26779.1 thioesterase [Hydrocarboniclastica marina]